VPSRGDTGSGMRRQSEDHIFRLDGEYWTVTYEERTVRLRDTAGLRYLVGLLRRPGDAVHSSELRAGAVDRGAVQGGRRRLALAHDERDRLAVAKGVRTALARIKAVHPALGMHLEATVRCGYVCRYLPDPRHPIRWRD